MTGHPVHAHAHGHAHAPERGLIWAMALTGAVMLAELAGGIWSGSLALIADAGHMLTDLGALGLAHAGMRLGRRPADPRRSFGYRRLEVLAAFANGVLLILLTLWIAVEAVRRLLEPAPVAGAAMLAVAALGLAVNIAAYALLRRGARENIGVAGALAHVLGDLVGSAGTILAGLVILSTGWTPIDPLLSLAISALILRSGWDLLRRSGHILLEGTPEDVDPAELARAASQLQGVAGAHHVHVWSLTSGARIATLHLRLAEAAVAPEALAAVRQMLRTRFAIEHSTIELDLGHGAAAGGAGAATADAWLGRVFGASGSDELARRYDAWAETYDADMLTTGYLNPAVVAGLVCRHVADRESGILDAGCGTGLIGETLAVLGYTRLIGLDMSDGMLERARRRGVYAELRKGVLGERLDFSDESFAGVIACGVFTAGHAPASALEELARVTRRGGRLVIAFAASAWETETLQQTLRSLDRMGRWRRLEETPPYRPMPLSGSMGAATTRACVFERL
jgi:cobalt-zinc-cadmium efflux system protein